jgi:hypothetical protein
LFFKKNSLQTILQVQPSWNFESKGQGEEEYILKHCNCKGCPNAGVAGSATLVAILCGRIWG